MNKAEYDSLQECGVTSFKVPLPDWLGKDTPELREKLQSFIDSLGRDQLIGELRAAYRRMHTEYERGQRDLLNALLAPNPAVSAKIAKLCNRDPDEHGRITVDAALWVTEVAEQLGIKPSSDYDNAPTDPTHGGKIWDGK